MTDPKLSHKEEAQLSRMVDADIDYEKEYEELLKFRRSLGDLSDSSDGV